MLNFRITDQIGRELALHLPPRRIVSCVPSQTELLYDLGLHNSIVGVTKFCIHPLIARQNKAVVGGTKNLQLEKIAAQNPDFVLANKEENDKTSIEWLAARFPTYVSDVRSLKQALKMIRDVGEICDSSIQAAQICSIINDRFSNIPAPTKRTKVAYIIWQNPWMTINSDTFIHDMLHRIGCDNVFSSLVDSRYPTISTEQIRQANPHFIFLSSEPFPFQKKHLIQFNELFPNSQTLLVDGEMFSWYGSRLQHFNTHFMAGKLVSRDSM
jgi:ABC-type Fe3+-hydroxamate transport system substrate-binding protein